MRRRRRPDKEIHFSFDSFLDVVANVVGIIIKLILVAWVGARTYKGFEIPETYTPNTPNITETKLADSSDPLVKSIFDKSKNKATIEAMLTSKKNTLNEEVKEKALNKLESDVYFDGDEIQLKLQKAIALLPEKQQLVFKMKYFEELKYEEISEILGTSVGALKASYHIAVKKIEDFLKTN